MLSNKCKYAIRAVIYLASRSNHKQMIGGTEVAHELKMPVAFTVKILQELARHQVVSSVKGPKGGFYIDESMKSDPILKVVLAIDGDSVFHRCGIGLHTCSDTHPCPFHDTFKANREKLLEMFRSRTIGDFSVDFLNDRYFLTDETD